MAVWNQANPPAIRSRTAAIEMVSYHTGPSLHNAEAGLAAPLFGVRASVISGGVLCVAGSLVLVMILPKFIAYDSTEGVQHRQFDGALFARAKDAAAE
jgi:hypothetical protein